jgi:hypothetical protein
MVKSERRPGDPIEEAVRHYKGLRIKVYVYEVGSGKYLARGDVEVRRGTQFGFSARLEAPTMEAAKELGFQRGIEEADTYLSDPTLR